MQSKNGFKICEGISCSSFSVKELDVIVHKNYFLYNHIHLLAILYPTSLANLVAEVGTRHSHQILLIVNNDIETTWNSRCPGADQAPGWQQQYQHEKMNPSIAKKPDRAPSQYKDRLSYVWDSHVKDNLTWGFLYW